LHLPSLHLPSPHLSIYCVLPQLVGDLTGLTPSIPFYRFLIPFTSTTPLPGSLSLSGVRTPVQFYISFINGRLIDSLSLSLLAMSPTVRVMIIISIQARESEGAKARKSH